MRQPGSGGVVSMKYSWSRKQMVWLSLVKLNDDWLWILILKCFWLVSSYPSISLHFSSSLFPPFSFSRQSFLQSFFFKYINTLFTKGGLSLLHWSKNLQTDGRIRVSLLLFSSRCPCKVFSIICNNKTDCDFNLIYAFNNVVRVDAKQYLLENRSVWFSFIQLIKGIHAYQDQNLIRIVTEDLCMFFKFRGGHREERRSPSCRREINFRTGCVATPPPPPQATWSVTSMWTTRGSAPVWNYHTCRNIHVSEIKKALISFLWKGDRG